MVQSTPDSIGTSSFLSRLFSNPIFGMAASLASVLGLILSIYFYVQSTRKRDLVYLVNPVQAVVVKTGEATNLHVLYGDRELKSDVTAAQIALWNQGNESIRPENILQQVEIRTVPAVPILEASIRRKSRGVIDVSLDQSRLGAGIVGVKWNILEQGDGAAIQLVYAGPPTVEIEASGTIEGQHEVRRLEDRERTLRPGRRDLSEGEFGRRFGWATITLGLLFLFAVIGLRLRFGSKSSFWSRRPGVIRASFIVLPFLYIAMGIFVLLFLTPPNPPFGF